MGLFPYKLIMETELIKKIENAATQRGVAASTFCRLAVNDGSLIRRLREGKSVTLATVSKLDAFISSTNEVA